jgi:aspartyl-tRNA(Asn)/glutamyl-tRNA(Gln) amidotransferase subunit A
MTSARYSATDLVAGYRDGSVSPVEATQAALDAINAFNDEVNAYVLVDADAALTAAAESAARWRAGRPLGPGDGVPTSIKDILLTSRWPTLRGSALIEENGDWSQDAPCVARLRETGAVLLGKTSTPEFGWKGVTDSPRFGRTGNPWNSSLTPGGSSGGSAAAISLGMGAWSVGTDGGGSVRIPAGFSGIVALKPTYGLAPAYPASPFGTLAHVGPMARTVADVALLLDILTGFDSRDWSALATPTTSFGTNLSGGVRGLRIAFSANLGYVRNDPEVEAAVTVAAGRLADLGAIVEAVDPGFTDPVEAFQVLWFAGAAKVLQDYDEASLARVDPGLLAAVARAGEFSASDYLDATAVRMDLGVRMGRLHETYDLLLTPTLPIPPFPVGMDVPPDSSSPDWTSWTPYTYPFNMTQQPAISVPCGFTSTELPIGLQLIGRRHADALVLRAAHAYETSVHWVDSVPPIAR